MASSFFSYNVTRPYPFRWFTLFVVLGGSVAFVAFTVLNLITSGYYLSAEFAQNPNATMDDGPWFRNWPSYFSGRMLPSCEPATVPVGTRVFTNHSGLTYTLDSVFELFYANNSKLTASSSFLSPGLSYLNHPLEDCNVNMVQIDLDSTSRAAWQFATQQWGSTTRAFIDCKTFGPKGVARINLTVNYDLLPENLYHSSGFNEGDFPAFKFLKTDPLNSAALWWGESLLSLYWDQLSLEMQIIRGNVTLNNVAIRKGTIVFIPSASQHDITNLEFFNVGYRFIRDNSGSDIIFNNKDNYNLSEWSAKKLYPDIWLQADSLAKSLYSVVLADLGQNRSSILTSPDALQYFTKDVAAWTNHVNVNTKMGPANDSYDNSRGGTGSLEITPAVLAQKYLCQVPRRKAVGSLIMTILLANLVLLSTCWTVLSFVTSTWVLKRDPTANYCAGCASQLPVPLMDLSSHGNQQDYRPVKVKAPEEVKITTSGYIPLPPDDRQWDRPWSINPLDGVRRKPVPIVS